MVQPLNSFPTSDGAFPGWQAPVAHSNAGMGIKNAQFGDDARLNVRFYMRPTINEFLTEQNLSKGIMQKHIDYVEHVRIQPIGDRTTVYDQPAMPRHKARFPHQYEAFKSGRQERVGIPLEAWDYQLSETEILTFKILGIEYVHQIANMNDVQQNSLGIDAKNIMARAKLTCSETSEKEAAAALQAKFDAITNEMAELRKENELLAQMARIRDVRESESRNAVTLDDEVQKIKRKRGPNKPKGELV